MSIKNLIRSPMKTLITFLLISLAVFALVSRVVEFFMTSYEMEKLEDGYIGVIALDNGVPYTTGINDIDSHYSCMPATRNLLEELGYYNQIPPFPPNSLTLTQMKAFSELSGVRTETRYMTAGFIREYRTIDNSYSPFNKWGFDYTSRFVIEGTYGGVINDLDSTPEVYLDLLFDNITVLAGNFKYLPENGEAIRVLQVRPWQEISEYGPITSGRLLFDNRGLGQEMINNLIEGTRYILIGVYPSDYYYTIDPKSSDPLMQAELERLWEWDGEARNFENTEAFDILSQFLERMQKQNEILGVSVSNIPLLLGDVDTKDLVFPIMPIEKLPDGFPNSGTSTLIEELVEIVNLDPFTYDIVYTEDMQAISRFNSGKMVIRDGRALEPQDATAAVVSWYFFETHGLSLGDTITIELGDRTFPQYASLGATAYIPERRSNFIKPVDVEIVGVYLDIDSSRERNANQFWSYGPNTIFVPASLLPFTISPEHEIRPGEFSIVIENARDIEAILPEAEQLARDLGLELHFSDGGWSEVANGIDAGKQVALMTALLYILGATAALFLSAYIFIMRNRKGFAISRALGMNQKNAIKSLTLSFTILSVPAVLVGSILGALYSIKLIEISKSRLAEISSTYTTENIIVSKGITGLCILSSFFILAVSISVLLAGIRKKPILCLMQNGL